MRTPFTHRNITHTPISILIAAFVMFFAAIYVVGIHGNFPLNDDWSYAEAARSLVLGHDWRPTGWTSATLVTQSLWAAPFCAIGDCSNVMLRLSSFCAAGLVLAIVFLLVRRLEAGAWYGAVVIVVTMFNPLNFALQFTFMTEMVFLLFLLASVLFTLRVLETDHLSYVVVMGICAVAATLCRQLGLCVPFAFAVTYLIYQGPRGGSRRAIIAATPFIICVVALLCFNHWMDTTGRTPELYHEKSGLIVSALAKPGYLVQRVVWNSTVFLIYLGLMIAPLTIGRSPSGFAKLSMRRRLVPIVLAGLFGCMFVGVIMLRKSLMPISGDIMGVQGIGPMLLYGVDAAAPVPLPLIIRLAMTVIGLFGAIRLIYIAAAFAVAFISDFRGSRRDLRAMTALFLLLTIVIYFVPIASITFYDRYVMPMIPVTCAFLLVATAAPVKAQVWPVLEGAVCLFLACYAILGVHDYMNWNRARWQAIADLERSDHANAHNIDGGLEFNGAELYNPAYVPKDGMSFWWIDRDTYQITPRVIPGETLLRTYAYKSFLMPGSKYIYVMEKQ